jgi:hypothetical protein
MTFLTRTALALAAVAVAGSASAADGFRPLLGAALTGGGEKLATVVYTDGSSENIKSGGLFQLFGGFEYDAASWAVQASIGYHVDDTNAKNGSVKFSRVPLELLAFWKVNDLVWLGGGVRLASGAKVTSSGAASSVGNIDFDSNAGLVVQGEYFFGPKASAFLRYVVEDYTLPGTKTKIGGNHIGLGATLRF